MCLHAFRSPLNLTPRNILRSYGENLILVRHWSNEFAILRDLQRNILTAPAFVTYKLTRREARSVTHLCCHAHHLKPESDLHVHTSENTQRLHYKDGPVSTIHRNYHINACAGRMKFLSVKTGSTYRKYSNLNCERKRWVEGGGRERMAGQINRINKEKAQEPMV